MQDQYTKNLKALEWFKDWSNYLLVTSVAALGWIAGDTSMATSLLFQISALALAISVVFGIFTLALVPHIAEQMKMEDSFQKVGVSYQLFGRTRKSYIWQACRPQHILFILGVLCYAFGKMGLNISTAAITGIIGVVACVLWFRPDVVTSREGIPSAEEARPENLAAANADQQANAPVGRTT